MASTTSDSLPSPPSLTSNAADQELSSVGNHSLFLPSSSPASLCLDSTFHGFIPTPTPMSPSPARAPAPLHPPPAPLSKLPRKRPRASRRPPTTVLTTDTSNFLSMVQEFTGFPDPPFAARPTPSVRPRLLGSASAFALPFLLRSSPLKYPDNPALPPPTSCTTSAAAATSSLEDAIALFSTRPNNALMPIAAATSTAAADQYGGGGGRRENSSGDHGFFSSLGRRHT